MRVIDCLFKKTHALLCFFKIFIFFSIPISYFLSFHKLSHLFFVSFVFARRVREACIYELTELNALARGNITTFII